MSNLGVISVGTYYKIQCHDPEVDTWNDVSLPRVSLEDTKIVLYHLRDCYPYKEYRVMKFEVRVTLLEVVEEAEAEPGPGSGG